MAKSFSFLSNISSQVIQDLRNSNSTESGLAYCYLGHSYLENIDIEAILPTWMCQLALRCSCVPSGLSPDMAFQKLGSSSHQYREFLLHALFSILPNFRRTYIILDGLDTCGTGDDDSHARMVTETFGVIRSLLEQDFGNVSIAIFSRPERSLDNPNPIFDLADVSIRLLKAEPSPDTLHGYCRSRVEGKVMPELEIAGFRQPEIWLDDIENAISRASDGL